jgi:hypothetical protein
LFVWPIQPIFVRLRLCAHAGLRAPQSRRFCSDGWHAAQVSTRTYPLFVIMILSWPPNSTPAPPHVRCSVNLRKRLEGQPLLPSDRYLPQERFLGLLGTGDGGCVASRGNMALQGRYLWDLKDWIDRKWMHVYSDGLPDLEEMMAKKQGGRPELPLVSTSPMHTFLERTHPTSAN